MTGVKYDLHLPPEICCEILTRLPIKSILRFRSVSKPWLSLISCPNFKPKTLSDRILLNFSECVGRAPNESSLSSHNESFSESRDIDEDLPDRFRGERIDPIGSCDGLICLYGCRLDRPMKEAIYSFIIYNPAIRKIVELPSLSFDLRTYRIRICTRFCAFGFDSEASDYKVMFLICDYEHKSYMGFMFDLRNGVWREFTPIMPTNDNHYGSMMNCPKFYLDDAVHWIGYNDEDDNFILSFNLSNETFRVISMPEELSQSDRPLIMTSGGLIYGMAGDSGEMSELLCAVWAMKEYGVTESWTKVFTIEIASQFWSASVCALIFRGSEAVEVLLRWTARSRLVSGKFVAADVNQRHLILHNNESGESKCLLSTDKSIRNMVFYKESLVLM